MNLLSRADLVALTGYKRPHYIKRWLRDNGFPFYIGADQWPRVIESSGLPTPKTLTRSVPNVSALKELQNGSSKKAAQRLT